MKRQQLEFGQYSPRRGEDGITEFGRAIAVARDRYDRLLKDLGKTGSEVSRSRTLESDPDIFPHNYIRNAKHQFIFPPQEVTMVDDPSSGELSGTRPYTLVTEIAQAEFDESKAEGRIEVSYDDAGSRTDFEVIELKDNSVLPPEAEAAITEAFGPFPLTVTESY